MREARASNSSIQLARELGPIDPRIERHYRQATYDDMPRSILSAERYGRRGIERTALRRIQEKHQFEFST